MIWFTADTHFGHAGILRHQATTRPFASTDEMDAAILDNLNAVVQPSDELYHIGDFAWREFMIGHYRARIRCKRVHLVVGNHDPRTNTGQPSAILSRIFTSVSAMRHLRLRELPAPMTLCHYALRVWDRCHYGAIHLHGHSHGSLPQSGGSLDVGVDCNSLKPYSLADVVDRVAAYAPTDHHAAIPPPAPA